MDTLTDGVKGLAEGVGMVIDVEGRVEGCSVRPLNDQVALVEDGPLQDGSSGAVIVPEGKALRWLRGRVMAVGPGNQVNTPRGLERVPVEVKLGSAVCFDRLACVEIRRDGVKYFVLAESDIRCELLAEGDAKPAQVMKVVLP